MRRQVNAIVDQQTRDLVSAWVTAFDEVSGELRAATADLVFAAADGMVTTSQALRSTQLSKSLAQIADKLESVAQQAGIRMGKDLPEIIRAAGEAQQAIIASQLPPSERSFVNGFSRVDPDSIDAIVQRSTEQITALTYPISDEAYRAVRQQLIQSVAIGDNPREAAAQMVKRTEGAFNGGLSRALTISRTEMLDAHRSATSLSMLSNRDTITGWTWLSALTERTCEACWGMNGTQHPPEEPGPEDHQNGRCIAVPTTKSWADLGIDAEEPPSLFPNAEEKFGALGVDAQQAILGPVKYDAWQSGKFPMSQWAEKRSTPGWRDSYIPRRYHA